MNTSHDTGQHPSLACAGSRNSLQGKKSVSALRLLQLALMAGALICAVPQVRAGILIQDGFDGASGDTNPTIYYIGAAGGYSAGPWATTPAAGSIGAITGNAYSQTSSAMNSGEVINFAPVALVVGDSIQLSFNFAYRTVPASGWLQCGLFNSMGATLSSSGAAPDGTTTHIGYFVQKNPAASTTDCAIYSTLPGGAGAGGITNATTPTKLGATFSTGVGADALISHSVNFTLALGSGNLLTTTFTLDGTSYVRTDSAPITTTFNEFMWDPSSWGGNASLVDNIVVSSYVSPEPSTWGLLAIGLGATFLIRARRTRICVRNQ